MYLVAILPPSNIRRVICDCQVALFRRNGNPAGLALPPHLPLASYDAPPQRPGGMVQETPLRTAGFVRADRWLLLDVAPAEEVARIASLLPAERTDGWYPPGRGVPLSAGGEGEGDVERCPELRWKSSELVCLHLDAQDSERWWEHLEYDEIWQVKLKRRIG